MPLFCVSADLCTYVRNHACMCKCWRNVCRLRRYWCTVCK